MFSTNSIADNIFNIGLAIAFAILVIGFALWAIKGMFTGNW
jgi:flagellar biogenesis protein FliO